MGFERCECRTIKATAVTVSATAMTITIVPLQAYENYEYYELCLGAALPAHTGIEPVAITDGTNTYPVTDTNGQPVVSGRMRGHKRYLVRFGAGGTLSTGSVAAHFTIYRGLCCMEYSSNAALQDPPVTVDGGEG